MPELPDVDAVLAAPADVQLQGVIQSSIEANIQTHPESVQAALTQGISTLTQIEARIKADSGNVNHMGIDISASHNAYMDFASGKASIEAAATAMVGDIRAVVATGNLTDVEVTQLQNVMAEIVGDAELAAVYVGVSAASAGDGSKTTMDGQAESGYNQVITDGYLHINAKEKAKLDEWKFRPDYALYEKHKITFDNPTYYDQKTGEIIYPGEWGDKNTNGFVEGRSDHDVMKAGKVYKRYGSNGNAKFFTEVDTPYEQLALPPGSDGKALVEITVLKDIACRSGIIASWFDQPGGGKQYFTDVLIEDDSGNMVEATMVNMEKYGYIEIRVIN